MSLPSLEMPERTKGEVKFSSVLLLLPFLLHGTGNFLVDADAEHRFSSPSTPCLHSFLLQNISQLYTASYEVPKFMIFVFLDVKTSKSSKL